MTNSSLSNGHANGHTSQAAGDYPNRTVEGYHTFLPRQTGPLGGLLPVERYSRNANPPKLFQPITIRGIEFPNRLGVAPMCMYSSDYGHATDHHFVHLGSMAMRGWGSIMVEATAVQPNGRISPEDSGIWDDSHIAPFKRIVDYVHGVGGKIGIQLAHAGRKASTMAPWVYDQAKQAGWTGGQVSSDKVGGWTNDVVGPSAITYKEGALADPRELTLEEIETLKEDWGKAVERAKKAGFDFIEIHGAHGYLGHEFVSPLSNKRTDKYGGSLDNRLRLAVELATESRKRFDGPVFYRVSASDWLEEVLGPEKNEAGEWVWWGLDQTTILSKKLHDAGVDLVHVSSGGNDPRAQYGVVNCYQVPFAEHIRQHVPGLLVGAVGMITDPQSANDILEKEKADIVFMARQVLRDIDFPLEAAEHFGVAARPAVQYERAWSKMLSQKGHEAAAKKGEGALDSKA